MKTLQAFGIFLSIILLSCKGHKETTAAPEPQHQPEIMAEKAPPIPTSITTGGTKENMNDPAASGVMKETNADPAMSFIVSFYSIGAGIDRGQTEKLMTFIESFGKKTNSTVTYTEIHWGREGETDYCFPLTGLPDSGISDFKTGVKEALKFAEHVHYLENQACRKGR